MIEIGLIHWIFLILFISLIFLIIIKKDTIFSYLVAIFILGLFATGSVIKSIGGIYSSLLYAFQDLSSIILAIAFVTALGKLLEKTGILEFFLKPITKIIINKYIGFWVIRISYTSISTVFQSITSSSINCYNIFANSKENKNANNLGCCIT